MREIKDLRAQLDKVSVTTDACCAFALPTCSTPYLAQLQAQMALARQDRERDSAARRRRFDEREQRSSSAARYKIKAGKMLLSSS